MKRRGGCVPSFGHAHDFFQTEKAENTPAKIRYCSWPPKHWFSFRNWKLFGASLFRRGATLILGSCGPGKSSDSGKSPQSGCERVQKKGLWAQSGQTPFAPVKRWVALVQNKVLVVQEPFLRLLLPCPKRPLAPSPNHFGRFA